MARKLSRAGNLKKPTQNSGVDDIDDDDIIEESDIDLPGDLYCTADVHLQDYLTKQKLLDSAYVISLYRYDNEHTQSKSFCGKFVDTIPSEHEIGLEYGSGKFITVLQAVNGRGKRRGTTSTFKIDKRYDLLKEQKEEKEQKKIMAANTQPVVVAGNPIDNTDQMLKLMQTMISMLIPLIRPTQQPQSMGEVMSDNFKSMNDVMKNVYMDNAQFYNDVIRDKSNLPEVVEGESEASGFMGILSQITPLIEALLPKITSRGQQSVDAVNQIKSMPGYNQVMKDKRVIKGLVSFIKEKHGSETAVKVARKFNLKVPKEKKEIKK